MKYFSALLLLILIGCIGFSCSYHPATKPTQSLPDELHWRGRFINEDLVLSVSIYRSAEDQFTGDLQLHAGLERLQNDKLSMIRMESDSLFFKIPSKETLFKGAISKDLSSIIGIFTFPDGSQHPFSGSQGQNMGSNEAGGSYPRKLGWDEAFEDLISLDALLREHHPNPFLYFPEEEYTEDLQQFRQTIQDSIGVDDLYRFLAPHIAGIGCNHTVIRPSNDWLRGELRFLPIGVAVRNDSLFLVSTMKDHSGLQPGSLILAINGINGATVISRLMEAISSDGNNPGHKQWQLIRQFGVLYPLIFGSSLEYRVAVLTDLGEETFSLAGIPFDPKMHIPGPPPAVNTIQTTLDAETGFAILTIPIFAFPDMGIFLQDLAAFFQMCRTNSIKSLVIDVRDNEGGHPLFAMEALRFLLPDSFRYFTGETESPEMMMLTEYQPVSPDRFKGKIYVLMNSGCTSTTGHFLAILKANRQVTFLGTQSGSGFSCNDFSGMFALPNSQIQVHIPRMNFAVAVQDLEQTTVIQPDIQISQSLEDQLSADDLVLKSAIKKIRELESRP